VLLLNLLQPRQLLQRRQGCHQTPATQQYPAPPTAVEVAVVEVAVAALLQAA